jgi:AcrR family transcriptional regulator
MKEVDMAKVIYKKHRANQQAVILESAENLFIQKGIGNVTVSDISKSARITKPTIYNYFPNKEDIATEIFRNISRGWAQRHAREVWNQSGNGYEMIELFMKSHFEYLFANTREASFVAEFNHLYAKEWSVEKAHVVIDENLSADREHLHATILKGQEDGSLRDDIDPRTMEAMIFNFISGMMSRIGEFGNKIDLEFNVDNQELFTNIYKMFLIGLKMENRTNEKF